MSDIARLFCRLFSSADGEKVLEHLKRRTFLQTVPPSESPETLRDLEGQRRLMSYIINLIERGHNE